MFSLVSSVALLGLIALIIPVLIHLFNPGKGRIIWVGNIELLRQAKQKAVTKMRFSQWLLLLLRLLILFIVTLLLAQLMFNQSSDKSSKTLTLLSPGWIKQASDEQLNAVLQKAEPIVLLAPGFTPLDRASITAIKSQPNPIKTYSHWSLLSHLDRQRSVDEAFIVYTDNQLAAFDQSQKPQLSRDVQWHVADEINRVVKKPPNNVTVTQNAEKAIYAIIYNDLKNTSAAKSVINALNSIKSHRLPGLTLQQLSDESPAVAKADWIFWLSAKAVPETITAPLDNTTVLFNQPVSKAWAKQADFPQQLLTLMSANQPVAKRFITPKLASAQIKTTAFASIDDQHQQKIPLHRGLLLLLIACWILERFLTAKPGKVSQ
ncbi:MAG: hypothetical protein ACI9FJ_001788 [Alteromonadaceae bacterium]|jgi:hypothetical protein